MRLRSKTILIVALTLVVLAAVVYTAAQVILMGSYADMENHGMLSMADSAQRELEYDLGSLKMTAEDYATWDDTYAFIEDRNLQYIDSNMGNETLDNLRLNLLLIINSSGDIVYGKALDRETGGEVPLPAGIMGHLRPEGPLLDSEGGNISGVLMLPAGPMLVAACPVVQSDYTGPARGMLIMGRYVDDEEIAILSDIAGTGMTVFAFDGPGTPAEIEAVKPLLQADGRAFRTISSDTIAGYALVRDVYGDPALVLRVESPRFVYKHGQASVEYFTLALILAGLILSLIIMYIVERTVISRMARFGESVHRIGKKQDLSVRVPETGDDEVSHFARTLNMTLDRLEQSQKDLHASEERSRSLVESINDIVWETDGNLQFTYVSPQVRGIMGYVPRDLIGKTPFDLMQADERDRIGRLITDMVNRKGEFSLVDLSIRHADGSMVDLEISGMPFRDLAGKITGFRGIARDVRERKRTEAALKRAYDDLEVRVQQRTAELKEANRALTESESKYRELVQNANSMIIRFDMDSRITYFNEFACSFFGYSQEEIIGKSVLETIVPQTESSGRDLSKHVRDLLQHPDQYVINVNENVRRNGERVWVSWTNKAVIGRDGRIEDILAIGNDVTDLKHASEELKRVNDSLESIVQERTAELGSAVKALQAEIAERKRVEQQMMSSLQEKEVLLKEIHHRVKNNLQIISSLLSLQSENINNENPASTFRESQDRIRSMALIHEKLYQAHDISRVDFAEYVRSLTAYLSRSYMTGPGVEIVIDIEGVFLDIDQAIPCGLIINELVSNSLKYAFPGGRSGEIRVSLSHSGSNYILTVGDNGRGLPPGLDFRNTASLGLQLVNTLVSQLEGDIELISDKGTAFRIDFPGK